MCDKQKMFRPNKSNIALCVKKKFNVKFFNYNFSYWGMKIFQFWMEAYTNGKRTVTLFPVGTRSLK